MQVPTAADESGGKGSGDTDTQSTTTSPFPLDAARKERQPEAAGRANGQVRASSSRLSLGPPCGTPVSYSPFLPQVSEAADPQEVTYSQVTCHVPHQGTAGAPSRVPRQTQSSEYVTLAFR